MSSGITITPGTFATAPAPSPLRIPEYPQARNGFLRRRPMQYESRPQAGSVDPFDDSRFDLGTFTAHWNSPGVLLVEFGAINLVQNDRRVTLATEWRDLPANHRVEMRDWLNVWVQGAATAAGTIEAKRTLTISAQLLNPPAVSEFYNFNLQGQTWPIADLDFAEFTQNGRSWRMRLSNWTYRVRVVRVSDSAVIREWEIAPRLVLGTITMDAAQPVTVDHAPTGRAMRVIPSLNGFQILTPLGWTVTVL